MNFFCSSFVFSLVDLIDTNVEEDIFWEKGPLTEGQKYSAQAR